LKVNVRLSEERDISQFVEWELSTANNDFDPAIAQYPSLRTLVVEIDGEPAVYAPFQPVVALESLGQRPGMSKLRSALALRHVQDTLEAVSRHYGMSEIWFQSSDEDLVKFAEKHGYEVLKNSVTLRKKLR
jgi:hypothetical protein